MMLQQMTSNDDILFFFAARKHEKHHCNFPFSSSNQHVTDAPIINYPCNRTRGSDIYGATLYRRMWTILERSSSYPRNPLSTVSLTRTESAMAFTNTRERVFVQNKKHAFDTINYNAIMQSNRIDVPYPDALRISARTSTDSYRKQSFRRRPTQCLQSCEAQLVAARSRRRRRYYLSLLSPSVRVHT